MNKTILFGGSIIAVVLIVLASFANVVGIHISESSRSSVDSPLFGVRIKKAINENSKDSLTSNYLGKGIRNIIQFPTKDNRAEFLSKVVEFINKMDDKTFEQFKELCVKRITLDKTIGESNTDKITQMLFQLKMNPELLNRYFNYEDEYQNTPTTDTYTLCPWFPGCYLEEIFAFIIIMIVIIFMHLTYTILCTITLPCEIFH